MFPAQVHGALAECPTCVWTRDRACLHAADVVVLADVLDASVPDKCASLGRVGYGVVWCGVVWYGVCGRSMVPGAARACAWVCMSLWLCTCVRVCVCVCHAP